MQNVTETKTPMLPLSLITAGDNPRKYFDPAEMEELISSVRANGIYQPILVRPIEGGFQIVAGERRFRAACEVFGEEGSIPAVVMDLTDEQADEAALIENTVRADMSVTEEAVSAGRILDRHNGSREEAAAVLGWPLSKLNRRLALLNLTEEVMTALSERKIMVGHAELLAAIPQDKQGKALGTITERKLTVQQVRDLLIKVSTDFSRAIFDTATCGMCQHNSTRQADLFSVAVEQGRCTNADCFKSKTGEKIEAIKTEIEEEYPNVRLIEVGDSASYVAVTAEGNLGVGEEQLTACKGCANYGATVSAIPGEEGKVERSICFDAACHQKMVAARIKAGASATPEAGKGGASTTAKTAGTAAKKDGGKKAEASALSERVKEYRRKQVWDIVAENELRLQPAKASTFLLDLMITGDGSKVSGSKLSDMFNDVAGEKVFAMGYGNSMKNAERVHGLQPEQKRHLFTEAAVTAVTSLPEEALKNLLDFLGADLGNHWTINEEFLNLLTKSEIEAVCVDTGLAGAVSDFKKVIGGKKDEAIKAIMASGFDFNGKIPSILAYRQPVPKD